MALAKDLLLQYSTLSGTHTAKEHFNNISTGDEVPVNGTITLYKDKWHTVAIYRENDKIKEYFLDRLASKYGVAIEDLVERVSTWDEDNNKWVSFVPGFNVGNDGCNFLLVDGEDMQGFFVKMKNYDGDEPLTLDWSSN